MIKDKYDELISKLTEATGKGTVAWEKTSSSNEFQVKLGDNAVTISFYDPASFSFIVGGAGNRNVPEYSFGIVNSNGEMIECDTKEKGEPGFERLKTLFEEARRKYYKVDETIDDILKAL